MGPATVMKQILIGGDETQGARLATLLETWGLRSAPLAPDEHPAAVPADLACAVLYATGPGAPLPPRPPRAVSAAAPLVVVGPTPASDLVESAWARLPDPGPGGAALAAALRPCLESSACLRPGFGFRDFLNHELRTPLTAAGTALQTLALQLERAGGPSLDLVDIALRNIRRLERTIDWACDYVAEHPVRRDAAAGAATSLTDLVQDLDDLESPVPLTWATGAGDWSVPVSLDRTGWRRLLRQLLRAIAYFVPEQPVHLDLDLLGAQDAGLPQALLLVVNLDCDAEAERVQRTGAIDEAEQLRRLLAFTVSPDLAQGLELRYDVVRLSDRLRLRVMMPLSSAAGALLYA